MNARPRSSVDMVRLRVFSSSSGVSRFRLPWAQPLWLHSSRVAPVDQAFRANHRGCAHGGHCRAGATEHGGLLHKETCPEIPQAAQAKLPSDTARCHWTDLDGPAGRSNFHSVRRQSSILSIRCVVQTGAWRCIRGGIPLAALAWNVALRLRAP